MSNELSAAENARSGYVSKLLDCIRAEEDVGAQYRMLDMIPTAVQSASDNGRLTDSLEIFGARGINLHQQMLALKVLVASGREEWLASALGNKEMPEAIEVRIVGALANAGEISTVLKIADGSREACLKARAKASENMALAYLAATPDKRSKLTKDELISISAMLAKKLNPLAQDGILSKGSGGMRPGLARANGRSLKR